MKLERGKKSGIVYMQDVLKVSQKVKRGGRDDFQVDQRVEIGDGTEGEDRVKG